MARRSSRAREARCGSCAAWGVLSSSRRRPLSVRVPTKARSRLARAACGGEGWFPLERTSINTQVSVWSRVGRRVFLPHGLIDRVERLAPHEAFTPDHVFSPEDVLAPDD